MTVDFTGFTKKGTISFTNDTWDLYVYSAIIHQEDDGTYRMFYTAYGSVVDDDYGPATATSTDFITWAKPNVGEITYPTVAGNTNNNLIIFRDNDTPVPLELADVIWAEDQYVALCHNKSTTASQLWTSPDGEVWTFGKNAFTGDQFAVYAEPKAILYDGSTYKLYYQSDNGGTAQRRSIGYYESSTLLGTYTDQGHRAEFTSTDQDVQFYDMKTWLHAGKWWACVPKYNKTTEILGPLQLYVSSDNGQSWGRIGLLLENGTGFDAGLIAAGKPILVGGTQDIWHLIYVGSDDTHEVWPRTMQFADATIGETMATTEDTRINRPVQDTITDDDYFVIIENPTNTGQTQVITASTLKNYNVVSTLANGPQILDEASTVANPTLIPNKATDSGIGGAAGDISIIATGVSVGYFEQQGTLSATETSFWLYDKDGAAIKQVTVGANDSGGAGFKVLRIAN